MKREFIELRLSTGGTLSVLACNHLFNTYTQYLIDRGEIDEEFHDELDAMTGDILSLGEKLNKIKGNTFVLRMVAEEYRCLVFAVEYCACLLLTDEGESWFSEAYFPVYGLEAVTKKNARQTQDGFMKFADALLTQKTGNPQFEKIKAEVTERMNVLFPVEE